jgi:small subunit ribosomal protein S16
LVKIRLARVGNRNRPYYRVVVAEDSHRRDGRFVEIVGTYDPLAKPAGIEVQAEAVLRRLAEGAQPSDTVKQILKKSGVWAHWLQVKQGTAKIEDLTGRVGGTVERTRDRKPSKKAAAKIAEEAKAAPKPAEEKPAEPVAAEAEATGESQS